MAATKKAAPKVKATAKKAAPKKAAPKKARAKAAPAPILTTTPDLAPTPEAKAAPLKAVHRKSAPKPKKAASRKATLLRLSDKQKDFLRKILESGEAGYEAIKAELRSIEGLVEKKLVKKGPRVKGVSTARYHLTKAGQKHSAPTDTTPPTV